MNHLIDNGKIDNISVMTTDGTKKLTIGGHTDTYPVYKIRLDMLYFNDKNDRIATWISQYKNEQNIDSFDFSNREEYNSIIHEFITESNREAMNRTKINIELVGQRESGVVLNDGRIIDGNRRFTCLRELSEKKPEFGYLEAVILHHNIEKDVKQIKLLELNLQHGVDKQVDYDPIDRLVGIYNDIVENKLLTEEEYAQGIGEKSVKKDLDKAILMVEFLNFMNAPKQFHIARDLKLDGPLQELIAVLSKARTNQEKENLKKVAFLHLMVSPDGDMTRHIRDFKKITSSTQLDDFIEKHEPLAKTIFDSIQDKDIIDTKTLNEEIRSNKESKAQMKELVTSTVERIDAHKTMSSPYKNVEFAAEKLNSIDRDVIDLLSNAEKNKILNKLEDIDKATKRIRDGIES
jgi:hypothetical protein